ncbi:hypothetical protein BT96DRAFT_1015891 [Gymnopus androsaceus JB14]|uniref:Cora-domain-containing protein n=1 Tax=Gymnopus androsaceus JB14 TaxID=1447944 RepID=A0A6A4I782_9AGAR|nr:hypothetical protein BT96DRAFT_1015891 [Gymnopus androsaceus JB14]
MAKETKTPKDRFRAAVHKVIAMHKTTTVITSYGAGAEPGVNPRHFSADLRYRGRVRETCDIRVVDYSRFSIKSKRMSNQLFVDMMNDPQASERPSWSKVRWIDVGGISWDVLKVLALKYNIHPLALENILHTHAKATASKSDYYIQHLFLRILCLELRDENSVIQPSENATLDGEEPEPDARQDYPPTTQKMGTSYQNIPNQDAMAAVQVEVLKQTERVNVNRFPIFILLTRDGTVITLHRTTNPKLMEPILARLSRSDTLLRSTNDASFLVQSLLDLAVDRAIGVTEACEQKMKKFEKQILLRPKVSTVSNLHILTADINLHQRALEPLKRVIYGLRRYDVDRCIALLNLPPGEEKSVEVSGYMSHTAQIYLTDVNDHIEYILGSLDIVYHLSENLIGYSFNLTSYDMNVIMKRLTIVTVICLPLTFLTGYGGMNFENMWWSSKGGGSHTDLWFWIVTLPVMAVVMPLFFIPDLKRLYHTMNNRKESQKALRSYQNQRGLAGGSRAMGMNTKSGKFGR